MIDLDRKLVRRLRQRVREIVRADPALQRERKRTRVGWRHRRYDLRPLRFVVPLFVFAAAFGEFFPEWNVALLVIWSTTLVLQHAGLAAVLFHGREQLSIFFHQPVTNAAVFRQQWRFVLRSSVWVGVDWLAFGLGTALRSESLLAGIGAPLLAGAQWAVSLAFAITLARWRPRFRYAAVATMPVLAGIVLLQLLPSPVVGAYVGSLLHRWQQIWPAGWVAFAFASATRGQMTGFLLLLALGAGGAALVRWHWQTLGAAFSLETIFEYHPTEPTGGNTRWISAEADADALPEVSDEPLAPAQPETAVDVAQVRGALDEALGLAPGLALASRGFIERAITRGLTLRQRVLVDFLQPGGFGWSRGWLLALGFVAFSRLLFLAGVGGSIPALVAVGGTAAAAFPLFGGVWLGFNSAASFQARVALHSFVPLGFWEIARLLLSFALLRALLALPLLVLAVRYGCAPVPIGWLPAAEWALRGAVLGIAMQPLWVVGAFSKNSNDSSARGWFFLLIMAVLVVEFVLIATVGVMVFNVESLGLAVIAGLSLAAVNFCALLVYGWAFHRGTFDAVAPVRAP